MKKRKSNSSNCLTKFILFGCYIFAIYLALRLAILGISALIEGQSIGAPRLLIAIVISFFLYRIAKKKVQLLRKGSKSGKAAAPVKTAVPTKAKAPAPAPTVPAGPKYEHIHIKVAGVTFSNDDGTDRQQLLRKIKYGKAPFEDNKNLDVALKVQTFTNSDGLEEPAVGVYVNEYQIGFVPKDLIKNVLYALDQPTATITAIDISGGGTHDGTKYPYGCKVVIRYEK